MNTDKFFFRSNENHSEPPADFATMEKVREQMRNLFGCTSLPAIRYKGDVVPARSL